MADQFRDQINTARRAGYSDDELIGYLKDTDPRISEALTQGYKPAEILQYLAPNLSTGEEVARKAGVAIRGVNEALAPATAGATAGFMMGGPVGAGVGALAGGLAVPVADVLTQGYNKLTDSNVRLPSQVISSMIPGPRAETPVERVLQAAKEAYDAKVDLSGRESFASFERSVLLYSLDSHWREHLAALDHLRQGIHLRGYAQKDPKQEYRREAFELYGELLNVIKNDVVKSIMTVQIRSASELDQASESMNDDLAKLSDVQYQHADPEKEVAGSTGDRGAPIDIQPAPLRTGPKVGRNDPCPCGSGKKYKNCCGALA
mgnify:CR=1 FL=1